MGYSSTYSVLSVAFIPDGYATAMAHSCQNIVGYLMPICGTRTDTVRVFRIAKKWLEAFGYAHTILALL